MSWSRITIVAALIVFAFGVTATDSAVAQEAQKGKYLVLWEMDQTRIPIGPKERGDAWSILMQMVKQDRARGLTTDWGAFTGESGGYTVFECSQAELSITLQQYVPFAKFEVHVISTESQVDEMIKALQAVE